MGVFASRVNYFDSQIPYGNTPNEKRFEMWLICCAVSWLYCLVSIYSYFSFTSLSHLTIISKRYPRMVRFECVMVMLYCLISFPLMAASTSRLEEFEAIQKEITMITWVVYPFLAHGIVDIEACRCWSMYFKLNHLYFTENKKWTDAINVDENCNNFWLSTQAIATYGNVNWCCKRIFCYYLFTTFSSTLMINHFGYNLITQFIDATFYGFPVVVVIFCFVKCPKIRDKFLFYFEFRTSAWFYISGLTIYFLNAIVFWFNTYYASISCTFIGLYSIPSVSILSALVIPKMITLNPLWNIHINKKIEILVSTSSGLNQSLSEMRANPATISMQTIFKKPALLQLFVSHALHEFSAENIFAYIEMKQFRDVFVKFIKGKATENEINSYLYQLPDHRMHQIPHSKIVFDKLDLNKNYDDDELKNVSKQIFMCFYEKYIADTAPRQVNICYDSRKQYDAYYIVEGWNLTMDEMLKLYDPILRETALLLLDVKYRFVRSKEFTKYNTPSAELV